MINERTVARDGDVLPASWLTVQIAFDADRGSDHHRIGSGAGEEREIPDGHEVEQLPEEDLGGARRPSAIAEDDTLWPRYPSKRAEFLFFCPQQNGEWMTIQGQENGDQSEAASLLRRVILGQKTTLGRLTSSVTPTSGNPVRECSFFQHLGNAPTRS